MVAALRHRFAQFFVVDQLAGTFHGGKQAGFVEAGGRLGGFGFDLDILGPDALVLF